MNLILYFVVFVFVDVLCSVLLREMMQITTIAQPNELDVEAAIQWLWMKKGSCQLLVMPARMDPDLR
jgi:hypothetical protein